MSSFFFPNRLNCFICASTIVERVDAARLFYAHPDDVGDVARYGRAWVHRRCWHGWRLREPWARSAARLLTGEDDVKTVSKGFVVCRITEHHVLLQDTWQAIEVAISHDQLKDMLVSIETTTESRITLGGVLWRFVANGHELEVTAEDEAQRYEAFFLEPQTWRVPLEQGLLLQEPSVGTD